KLVIRVRFPSPALGARRLASAGALDRSRDGAEVVPHLLRRSTGPPDEDRRRRLDAVRLGLRVVADRLAANRGGVALVEEGAGVEAGDARRRAPDHRVVEPAAVLGTLVEVEELAEVEEAVLA